MVKPKQSDKDPLKLRHSEAPRGAQWHYLKEKFRTVGFAPGRFLVGSPKLTTISVSNSIAVIFHVQSFRPWPCSSSNITQAMLGLFWQVKKRTLDVRYWLQTLKWSRRRWRWSWRWWRWPCWFAAEICIALLPCPSIRNTSDLATIRAWVWGAESRVAGLADGSENDHLSHSWHTCKSSLQTVIWWSSE